MPIMTVSVATGETAVAVVSHSVIGEWKQAQAQPAEATEATAVTRAIIWARVCRRPGMYTHFINNNIKLCPGEHLLDIFLFFSSFFFCFTLVPFWFGCEPAASELLDSMLMHELWCGLVQVWLDSCRFNKVYLI